MGGGLIWLFPFWLGTSNVWSDDPPPKDNTARKADDLSQRLVRKAVGDSDDDLMSTIIRMMNEVSRKLEVDFDPGEETRALQNRIEEELNSAIKEAAARRRQSTPSEPSAGGDKRRKTTQPRAREPSSAGKGRAADSTAEEAADAGPDSKHPKSPGGEMRESRRAWGHLPQRERDEVIQGADEGFLERYRAWIERYYRALQEAGE